MPTYHQGKFSPRNPDKYVGGDVSNITYRSSWEKKVMIRFDSDPSILKWNSEDLKIKYISPVDNRIHNYHVDFTIEVRTKTGEIKKFIVEVKPLAQTKPPVAPKRKTARYITEVTTFAVNTSKWKAAKNWASQNGFEFVILTEKEIGIK